MSHDQEGVNRRIERIRYEVGTNFARMVAQLRERLEREGKLEDAKKYLAERAIYHYQTRGSNKRTAYRRAWFDVKYKFKPDHGSEAREYKRKKANRRKASRRREYMNRKRRLAKEKEQQAMEEEANRIIEERDQESIDEAQTIGIQDVTKMKNLKLPIELAFAFYNLHMVIDADRPSKRLIKPSDAPDMACWNMLMLAAKNRSSFQQTITKELIAIKKAEDDFIRKEEAKRLERAEKWNDERERLIKSYEEKISQLKEKAQEEKEKEEEPPGPASPEDMRDFLKEVRDGIN